MGKLKFVSEKTMFKVLVERDGILLSVTTKRRAYFLFLSRQLIGGRIGPTTDPFPGIVELCDYDIPKIVASWESLHRVKLSV